MRNVSLREFFDVRKNPSIHSLGAAALGKVSEQINVLLCGVVSPTPISQPRGPVYPFLSGSSPLTFLAWEVLPVAYATASIALGIIWPRKRNHDVRKNTYTYLVV
jgi:hypothetical protein